MNIVLKGLSTKVDNNKTTIELEHMFQPLDNEPELIITCSYFRPGEITKYYSILEDGTSQIDIMKVFRDKVSSIDGLSVEIDGNRIDIKTVDDFLALPGTVDLTNILSRTATHLITGDNLTKDEVKN